MRTQSVILNLIPSGVNPVVHLSQYDQENDGALLFNIYDGNVLADLTGCTATIEGTKPDGTYFMYPCTVYSTYLTSAVNFQMTSIAGSYPAEVRINRGAENVGTINLTMMVEPAGVGRVDVSDTDIPSLLDDIETSVDEAEYWAHVAEQAVTGVASWNGRTGAVNPAAGDYTAAQVDYDNSNSGSTATDAQGAIDERAPKKIITSNDAFDPTKTYTAGEWFIHQGVLYEVITSCTGITPPNATYYEVKTLHDLQSEIDALEDTTLEIDKTATDDNPLASGGTGIILHAKKNGSTIGHVAIRPIDSAGHVAINLYDKNWGSAQSVVRNTQVLLCSGTPTTANTWQTFNLPAGYKISDFSLIICLLTQYSNTYASIIEPRALFDAHSSTGSTAILTYANWTLQIYKHSDTSVGVIMNNVSSGFGFKVYGLL